MDQHGTTNEETRESWTRKDIASEAGISPDLLRHYERQLSNFLHPIRQTGKALRYDEVDARMLLEAVRLKTRRGFSMKQIFAHFNGENDEPGALGEEMNASSERLLRCLGRLEAMESQGQETDRKVEILAEAATKLLAQNQALFALCRDMQGVLQGVDARVDHVDRRITQEGKSRKAEGELGFFGRIRRLFLGPAPIAEEEALAPLPPSPHGLRCITMVDERASVPAAAPSAQAPSPASPSPGFGEYFRRFSDAARKVEDGAPWFLDFLGPAANLGRQREGGAAR